MAKNYRALLIDLDGVLRHWRPSVDDGIEDSAGLPAGSVQRAAFSPELLIPAITGLCTDDEWRSRVATKLREDFPNSKTDEAVKAWSASAGEIDQECLKLVSSVRGPLKVVLITNATSRLKRDLELLGIERHFDWVINSSEVGSVKPDADIFTTALNKAEVTSNEALFVDDSSKHVEAARSLGIESHQYVDVSGLQIFFRSVGIVLPGT